MIARPLMVMPGGDRLIPSIGQRTAGIAGAIARDIDDADVSLGHFALAKYAFAKSIAALIEVRPVKDRGALRIAAAAPPPSSSSRISVQSEHDLLVFLSRPFDKADGDRPALLVA